MGKFRSGRAGGPMTSESRRAFGAGGSLGSFPVMERLLDGKSPGGESAEAEAWLKEVRRKLESFRETAGSERLRRDADRVERAFVSAVSLLRPSAP